MMRISGGTQQVREVSGGIKQRRGVCRAHMSSSSVFREVCQ